MNKNILNFELNAQTRVVFGRCYYKSMGSFHFPNLRYTISLLKYKISLLKPFFFARNGTLIFNRLEFLLNLIEQISVTICTDKWEFM